MPTFVQRLRESTHDVHAQQEQDLAFLSSLETREAYTGVLAAFLGLHQPLEAGLADADWTAFPPPGASRAAAIRSDLAELGWSAADIAAAPMCPDLPAVDGLPAAIGVRYVLDGSALGGLLIARWISDRLELPPGFAQSFFGGRGRDPRRDFRGFLTAADASGLTPAAEQRAVDAALETFAVFTDWLGEHAAVHTAGGAR
ncbi:biliverdin-producing heme oxygenase [Kitasatospora sp. NPDC093102]|uniref:biliverdin-producing heme oxygenase n=1 Tax=Kitasatospora sp. NPDC093102 TaxID=3155069 RepID=UPI00342FCE7C